MGEILKTYFNIMKMPHKRYIKSFGHSIQTFVY